VATPDRRRRAGRAGEEEKEEEVKRHLTTIVLVIAAVALVVYVWLDKNKLTTSEQKARESSVFPAWRRDELTRIEIAHEGETVVLARENKDASWRMTSPREERVDQGAAERLTTTLEFANRVRPVVANDALGLEHPRASGAVTMGAMTFHIVLGGPSPRPEGSSYAKVDDGAPFVCSKELTEALLASSDTYRDRSVVPYLSLDLSKLEVTHPAGGFVVERLDLRSFKVAGLDLLASRHALDRAWSALAEMRAEAFPKDADADRLTANPQLTIRMTPKDNTKGMAELVVGGECPGHKDDVVVLRKQPTRAAACAPKGAIDALRGIAPAELVDRTPFSFRHDEIEEVRWEGGEAKPIGADVPPRIELARKGVGFHEREPVDRELPPEEAEAARELLVAIEKTVAKDVQPGHGAPFTSIAKAKVWAGDHDETVEVGAVDKDAVVVRRLRDDARLTLSPAEARRLVPRETTLRPLTLMKETRRVTRVALRCGVDQDLEDTGSGLKLVKPAGYETDGSITQLVEALVRGKVLEWNADRDDGSFGIKEDGCRVTLSFEDGNNPRTVLFGAAAEGGVFGRMSDERAVFVASKGLETLVRTIYVSRAMLRVEDAEKVTATVKGKPVPAKPQGLATFFAERVASVGSSDVGPVDLELVVTREGGSQRIVCSASEAGTRRCATRSATAKAVFEVKASTIAQILEISDAGKPDAG
jgi:hypothetical protein